jgi:SHS2 domain-containing protein
MKPYELLDISGDAGLKIQGRTPKELFGNAASGMYSLITATNLIKEKKTVSIAVQSSSLESLFVSWLNELIFHFDTYGFIGKTMKINSLSISKYKLNASVSGESFDKKRHQSKLLIKAATYHELKIKKTGSIWEASVIFDI